MNFKIEYLLRSGNTFSSSEYELETKYVITNLVLWAVMVVELFLLILSVSVSNFEMAKINILAVFLSFLVYVMGHMVEKGKYLYLVYTGTISFMFVISYGYYLLPDLMPAAGWTLVLIVGTFLVSNMYIAMMIVCSFIVAVTMIKHNELGYYYFEYTIYHVSPVLLGMFVIIAFEKKFSSTIQLLEESNELLETRVKERTKELEKEKRMLRYQAHYDDLTALPNRAKFHKVIQEWIDITRNEKTNFALFFLDLDRFKRVNDSFGHNIGDMVLKTVSHRVQENISDGMFFARIGGDEFTLLLKYDDIKIINDMAEILLKIIKVPMVVENNKLYLSASIGISFYPKNSVYFSDLIKYADITMFEAKKIGKGSYKFYDEKMTHRIEKKVFMETDIHMGIDNDEFVLYYQPQIDMRNEALIGVEVLVRWNHPKLGMSMPDTFIPLAEETGVIVLLDYYILRKGMTQVAVWKNNNLDIPRVSFNFSTKHLLEKGFVEIIEALLDETSCKGEWIELEITESHVVSNIENAIVVLKRLRSLGIKVAIDDFGTGYTSLSYLKILPADKLKIDKSFIKNIPQDNVDMTIVKSIIEIGKSLGLIVMAEGVETQVHKDDLVDMGCYYAQGYYYYRPMSKIDLEDIFL
jgi:diguanylate cyclase (GGDEF)-like protein